MGIGLAALPRGFFIGAFAMTATANAATYLYVGNAGTTSLVLALDPKTGDLKEIEKPYRARHHQGRRLDPDGGQPDKKFLLPGSAASRRLPQASRSIPRPANSSISATARSPTRWPISRPTAPESSCSARPIRATSHREPDRRDGVVQAPRQIMPTPPNAHAILPESRTGMFWSRAWAATAVHHFRFDAATGTLTPTAEPARRPKEKAGPRHFRFTRHEKFVYLLNELDASVYVSPYDAGSRHARQGDAR